jgi:hypothetical protein
MSWADEHIARRNAQRVQPWIERRCELFARRIGAAPARSGDGCPLDEASRRKADKFCTHPSIRPERKIPPKFTNFGKTFPYLPG